MDMTIYEALSISGMIHVEVKLNLLYNLVFETLYNIQNILPLKTDNFFYFL